MNQVIFLGVRQLKTDEHFKGNRDFAIILIASRYSKEIIDDEEGCYKYRLKISHIDSLMDLKEHKEIKFKKGKSPSQKWRWLVEQELGEYDNLMAWQLTNKDKIFDLYKEDIIKE